MRVCEKCGFENPDPETTADSWCAHCGDFLGFPLTNQDRKRRIRLILIDSEASVVPGAEAVLTAQVHNEGQIVEKVRLTIDGGVVGWGRPEPEEVGLFPNQKSEVRLVFRPPRSPQIQAGLAAFRLMATSESDASVSDSAAGTLQVGPFVDVKASLSPLQSTGPSGAVHRLVVENAGNAQLDVSLTASQPGDGLVLMIDPPAVRIDPGARSEAQVQVLPREAVDGANSRTYPFLVSVLAPDQAPIMIQGVHVQEAEATVPTLVLAEARLHAPPGQEATTTVTVRNRGRGGENYSLSLLGPAAAWGRVVPPTIVLPAAGEVNAKVVFSPPASPPTPAADVPFGVRCVSEVDGNRSIVAEGQLRVDSVSEINFDVVPQHVRGRWSGRYAIDLENCGNAEAQLRPVVVDPEHDLSFAVSPPQLRVAAGGRAVVVFKARARRPKLLRKAAKRPFQVFLNPAADSERIGRERSGRAATFEQISILPRKMLLLLVTIAVVGGVAVAAMMNNMFS
jgi:hypothetical protein